jgi:hypothetical protein
VRRQGSEKWAYESHSNDMVRAPGEQSRTGPQRDAEEYPDRGPEYQECDCSDEVHIRKSEHDVIHEPDRHSEENHHSQPGENAEGNGNNYRHGLETGRESGIPPAKTYLANNARGGKQKRHEHEDDRDSFQNRAQVYPQTIRPCAADARHHPPAARNARIEHGARIEGAPSVGATRGDSPQRPKQPTSSSSRGACRSSHSREGKD